MSIDVAPRTARRRADLPGPWAPIGAVVATAAVATQLLEAGFDLLPGKGLIGPLTLGRLILVLGLVGVVAAGARLREFRTGLDAALALLVAAAVVTTVRGGWETAPLRFLVTAIATYYLVVATMRVVPESRSAIALVALASAAGAAAVGISQVAEGDFTGFYRDGLEAITREREHLDLQVRAIGPFANPNLLAAFVVLAAPVGATVALRTEDRGLRWGVLALLVIAAVGLVLTFSRGGIISLLVGATLVAWLSPRTERIRRPVLLSAAGLGIVLVAAALATGGRAVGDSGRWEAWRLALDAAAEDRISGIGLGRAGDVMNALGDGTDTYAHAHNLWLNWLAEAGPLAFVAIAFVSIWLVAEGVRLTRAGAAVPAFALSAVLAFLIMSVVDHPANSERVALAFWIVAGLLAADATRRITPGLVSGEADDDPQARDERATGVGDALADPVPPRAGPAPGESVRVLRGPSRPDADAGAGSDVAGGSMGDAPAPTPGATAPMALPFEPLEPIGPGDAPAPERAGRAGDTPEPPPEQTPEPLPEQTPEPEPPDADDASPAQPTEPISIEAIEAEAARPEPERTVDRDGPARFARVAARLAGDRRLDRATMMGEPGLRLGRRYLAALVDGDRLALRLPPGRVAELLAAGDGEPFLPAGRPLEGWIVLRSRRESVWTTMLEEALGQEDEQQP